MSTVLALTLYGIVGLLPTASFADPPPVPVAKSQVAHVEAKVPAHKQTSVIDQQDVHYSPQTGWAIISYHAYDTGSYGNTTKSWSSNPANFTASMSSYLQNSYQEAYELINNASILEYIKIELLTQLNYSYSLNASYVSSIQSSHAQVIMIAKAWGRGVMNTQGGSLIGLSLDTVEVPIPVCFMSQQGFDSQIVAPIKSALRRYNMVNPQQASQTHRSKEPVLTPDESDKLIGDVSRVLLAMAPLYTNGEQLRAFVQQKSGLRTTASTNRKLPKATASIRIVQAAPHTSPVRKTRTDEKDTTNEKSPQNEESRTDRK